MFNEKLLFPTFFNGLPFGRNVKIYANYGSKSDPLPHFKVSSEPGRGPVVLSVSPWKAKPGFFRISEVSRHIDPDVVFQPCRKPAGILWEKSRMFRLTASVDRQLRLISPVQFNYRGIFDRLQQFVSRLK